MAGRFHLYARGEARLLWAWSEEADAAAFGRTGYPLRCPDFRAREGGLTEIRQKCRARWQSRARFSRAAFRDRLRRAQLWRKLTFLVAFEVLEQVGPRP